VSIRTSRAGLSACALALVVAACAATTPPASPTQRVVVPSSSRTAGATPAPSATPTPGPAASVDLIGGFADELEVGSIPPEVSGAVLTFATDGASVLFASDRADDATRGSAPDLWRVTPGPKPEPELVWRNPERSHSIVGIGGDIGTIAWVETPVTGERAWNLWLVPRGTSEAVLLDSHPGDEAVSSLVPSFSIYEDTIVWTAFDLGPDGPVSQLKVARWPAWEGTVLAERSADEAELWLPSLYGGQLAFTEVRYSPDRTTDERHVYLASLGETMSEPRRLDASGRATMPLSVNGAVIWKETDPGFNMFNWGTMVRHDLESGLSQSLVADPQEYVNYPSAGSRYLAWWGADSFAFGVYDMLLDQPVTIAHYPDASQEGVLRPHIAWDLLVWLHVDSDAGTNGTSELRYALLPPLKPLP
jgi:hypothetical protein